MTRPQYQTEANASDETRIAMRFAEYFNVKPLRLPRLYSIDWALVGREHVIVGWLECKARRYTFHELDRLGGYMLALQKWWRARTHVCCTAGTTFFLAVECRDGIYYAEFGRDYSWNVAVKMAGRFDRGDNDDVEPCVFIPMQEFSLL